MKKTRVAIATSAAWPDLLPDDQLWVPHVAAMGFDVVPAIWTDSGIDWQLFDAVILRSTWDYFERFVEFATWLGRLEALPQLRGRIFNAPQTVLRNSDKVYLRGLEQEGVATLPTIWIDRGREDQISSALDAAASHGWDDLVVKPSISAGAFRTRRLKLKELMREPAILSEIVQDAAAMIQAFAPEVLAEGEWSFLFFGGEFSHAVKKQPKAGDFRVQFMHGGKHFKAVPPDFALASAERVMRVLDLSEPPRLFTRIDGVVRGAGPEAFKLIEAEMIEPFLFFETDTAAPARFAAAVQRIFGAAGIL